LCCVEVLGNFTSIYQLTKLLESANQEKNQTFKIWKKATEGESKPCDPSNLFWNEYLIAKKKVTEIESQLADLRNAPEHIEVVATVPGRVTPVPNNQE